MHFFGSERGLLATPTQVRDLSRSTANFVPWDALLPNQTSTQFFNIDIRARRERLSRSLRGPSAHPAGRRRESTAPAPTPPSR